jgi:hypothetical protein
MTYNKPYESGELERWILTSCIHIEREHRVSGCFQQRLIFLGERPILAVFYSG